MLDKTWLLYNKKLEEAMSNNNWRVLAQTYYEMAYRVQRDGIDASYLRAQGAKARQRYQDEYLNNHLIEQVHISTSPNPCVNCLQLTDRVLPAEDARAQQLLPYSQCISDMGCSCIYIPTS